jgi:hypothetical protein
MKKYGKKQKFLDQFTFTGKVIDDFFWSFAL